MRVSSPELKAFAEIGFGHVDEAIRQLKNIDAPSPLLNIGLFIAYRKRGDQVTSNQYKARLRSNSKDLLELITWQRVFLSRPNSLKAP